MSVVFYMYGTANKLQRVHTHLRQTYTYAYAHTDVQTYVNTDRHTCICTHRHKRHDTDKGTGTHFLSFTHLECILNSLLNCVFGDETLKNWKAWDQKPHQTTCVALPPTPPLLVTCLRPSEIRSHKVQNEAFCACLPATHRRLLVSPHSLLVWMWYQQIWCMQTRSNSEYRNIDVWLYDCIEVGMCLFIYTRTHARILHANTHAHARTHTDCMHKRLSGYMNVCITVCVCILYD